MLLNTCTSLPLTIILTNISPWRHSTYNEEKPGRAELCKRLTGDNTKRAGTIKNKEGKGKGYPYITGH
jgi:hypothetical protein